MDKKLVSFKFLFLWYVQTKNNEKSRSQIWCINEFTKNSKTRTYDKKKSMK